jgi:DUF1009 family protein
MTKLGLVAGGGGLPAALAEHCRATGRPYFVIRLRGFAGDELEGHPGAAAGIAEVGRIVRLAREAGCKTLCFAGAVGRPDFGDLKPDLRGLAALPGAIRAATRGDDALLRFAMSELQKEGFAIEGAHEVMHELKLPAGPLGAVSPSRDALADMSRAQEVARAIGGLDIGQAVVVCAGVVLAVEAQEGTDAMLARVAGLPKQIRGSSERRRGVLAKIVKPAQEQRVDLPTLGPTTVAGADAAGLAGIVGVAGRTLILDRPAVVSAADDAGIFVFGLADEPA